jgi:CBS-domain-containing membrane protein
VTGAASRLGWGCVVAGVMLASIGAAAKPRVVALPSAPATATATSTSAGAARDAATATGAPATAATAAAATGIAPGTADAKGTPPRPADRSNAHWPTFGAGIALILVGMVLTRAARRQVLREEAAQAKNDTAARRDGAAGAPGKVKLTVEGALAAVRRLHETVERLRAQLDAMPDERFLREVDEAALNDVLVVDETRALVAERLGPTAYAEMMVEFALGERYLNRSWTAVADGYRDEARESLAIAAPAFSEAVARFEAALRR